MWALGQQPPMGLPRPKMTSWHEAAIINLLSSKGHSLYYRISFRLRKTHKSHILNWSELLYDDRKSGIFFATSAKSDSPLVQNILYRMVKFHDYKGLFRLRRGNRKCMLNCLCICWYVDTPCLFLTGHKYVNRWGSFLLPPVTDSSCLSSFWPLDLREHKFRCYFNMYNCEVVLYSSPLLMAL